MNEQASKSLQNPYPGLRPYREDEKDNFFGREADCKILIDKILVNRLTLLFAATGVGKSSLLQAAVIPQLKSPRGENLDVVYYNDWISNPLDSLKQAVRQALEDSGAWQQAVHYKAKDNETLADFLHFCALFTRQPLIVVLDQFEEFFRYQKGLPVFEEFLEQLTGVFSNTHLPVHLVFSMREDFALELNAFKQFVPLSVFDNLYRLDKLRRKQARQAILAPLEATGSSYEPELLERLLSDLLSSELRRDNHNPLADRTESVEPPYLQIVCSQLWDLENAKDKQTGKFLHLKTYQQAGGAIGLLENYIQKVLKTFSEQEKVLASKAFDHLISRDGAKMPYKTVDLAKATGTSETELEKVLVKLAEARILRSQSREEKIWYELYHDMFSESIEGWNSRQKDKMRNRRMLLGGSAVLLATLSIYFGTIAYVHSSSHHLRLAPGDENRVEIFTGKQGWRDPFGQKGFYAETRLLSREIEPDKRFFQRGILDYQAINTDLIAYRPLEERISAYAYTGDYAKAIGLFEKTVNGSGKQASAVVRGLFSLKNLRSFEKIKPFAASEKNASVNKTALTLFRENINSLNLDKSEEFRFYEQILKRNRAFYINKESVKSSPLLFFKLLNYLKHPNLRFRGEAAQALGRVGDRVAVEGLLKALSDDDEGVRGYAAQALGRVGDRVAVEGLLKALSDDNEGVRVYAAKALGLLGDRIAVESLLKAFSDDSEGVRVHVAKALELLGDRVAVEGLLEALSDDNKGVRGSAAEALGLIGDFSGIQFKKLSTNNEAGQVTNPYRWHDFFQGRLQSIYGTVEHRQQLLAALNLPASEARDLLLLQLAADTEVHASIREKVITELGGKGVNKQQIITELKALSPEKAVLKRAIKTAIDKLIEKPQVPKALIKTKTQLTQEQDQLNKVRQQYAAWRSFRDSKTSENYPKPEDYDNFLAEVRTQKADIAPLAAFDHAYSITEADPKAGVELLTHPLARARQGAYTAFAMKANINILRTLDEKREQNRNDPIFRHAAFRAVDLGLQRLEALGNRDNNDKEYKELMEWQKRLEADKDRRQTHLDSKDTYPDGQPVDEVLERLQWTTMMMEHTKKMSAKFAKDGWVRDWPENVEPVNQPYPEIKP